MFLLEDTEIEHIKKFTITKNGPFCEEKKLTEKNFYLHLFFTLIARVKKMLTGKNSYLHLLKHRKQEGAGDNLRGRRIQLKDQRVGSSVS